MAYYIVIRFVNADDGNHFSTLYFDSTAEAFNWARRQEDNETDFYKGFKPLFVGITKSRSFSKCLRSIEILNWEGLIGELAYADADDNTFGEEESLNERNAFYHEVRGC